MESNFYIGIVIHKNFFNRKKWQDKIVLYSDDYIKFIDLNKQKIYFSNKKKKNYVVLDSLINIDINDFNIDYVYLLNKYNEKKQNQ